MATATLARPHRPQFVPLLNPLAATSQSQLPLAVAAPMAASVAARPQVPPALVATAAPPSAMANEVAACQTACMAGLKAATSGLALAVAASVAACQQQTENAMFAQASTAQWPVRNR
jgi:hypothetical protein